MFTIFCSNTLTCPSCLRLYPAMPCRSIFVGLSIAHQAMSKLSAFANGGAFGIALNIGDPFDMQQEVRPLSWGCINVTIVDQPPGDVVIKNPTSHLKVMSPCYETFAPLMKKVAKSYSPVCSRYFIIYECQYLWNFHSDHNYQVYVLDQQEWSIMGRYNVVVEDDEDVVWEKVMSLIFFW